MIGVVVATHGDLGESLLATATTVCGAPPASRAVSVSAAEPPDVTRARLAAAIDAVEDGQGVLVLCDLFGGTPCNLALSLITEKHIEVICGVNLPMLLKLTNARAEAMDLLAIARLTETYGHKHIQLATELIRQQVPK